MAAVARDGSMPSVAPPPRPKRRGVAVVLAATVLILGGVTVFALRKLPPDAGAAPAAPTEAAATPAPPR